jgi:cobalt/nickel transport system ATP-binding protein
MSHHLVQASHLSYRYPEGTEALRDVGFTIRHGESVALIGANGAGKSTLLLHLNGTLAPRSGEVRIGDTPVLPGTLRDIRRTVGMIFQDPDDQLFRPTVLEDVMYGPLNLGLPFAEAESRARQALEQVGAAHLGDRAPYRLSAGEKRRCAIAGVLAMAPDVLVMDEPTAGLDPRARRQLLTLLARFRHTKIIATHDLDLVLELCDRTLVLSEGRILRDGPTAEVFAEEELLKACGLEPPARLGPCPACGARPTPTRTRQAEIRD